MSESVPGSPSCREHFILGDASWSFDANQIRIKDLLFAGERAVALLGVPEKGSPGWTFYIEGKPVEPGTEGCSGDERYV